MQYFFWYVDIYINSLLSSFLALRIWIEPKFGKETRPKKRLGPDEKFTITGIRNDGESIEPSRTKDAFSSQCGVLVRDFIPISIHQWNKPKSEDPEVSFVTDRQKDELCNTLKANFILPPKENQENPVIEPLIKTHALKKMAELFRRWKNDLKVKFVDKRKTPIFTRQYEKIKDHWPEFVVHKTSEKSKKMSETNKKNAEKKKLHHCTGSGGYLKAKPAWDRSEHDLLEKGITPETWLWSPRGKTWFF